MTVTRKLVKQANTIVNRYNGYHEPREVANMYDELASIGIVVPMFTAGSKAHEYMYNDEIVKNSMFVYMVYEPQDTTRNEYTMYFS